jgi:hypothetical protein
MPTPPTLAAFKKAVDRLRTTGDPNEKDRASKTRHTWSMSGGKKVGGKLVGYLQLCLEQASKVGFL